ncbi:MAG: hypothetical protein U0169_09845 [Polyangiaceae bacterium]
MVLSRELADRGQFPAIERPEGISRLTHDVTTPEHRSHAAMLRSHLATHADARDLIQIGAYVPGSDARVDTARKAMPAIESFLRQSLEQKADYQDTLRQLASLGAAR